MIEYVQSLLRADPLEFYTAVIATLGIAFWAIDRRSMKAALRASRGAEINALRMERQKTEARVEQNFATLLIKCQVARNALQECDFRSGLMLRSPLHVTEEEKGIRHVEQAARSHLKQLKVSAPALDNFELEKLEAYFTAANRASLEFARLASQLPEPKNRFH